MIGGMAFAAPSFGIWCRTVFQLAGGVTDGALADDEIFQGWGPGWLQAGGRAGLHATFSNDKIEFKFTFYLNGLQVTDTDTDTDTDGTAPDINTNPSDGRIDPVNCYGTLKFIPDLLTVLVGRFDGDGWDNFRKISPNPNSDVHNNDIGRFNGWGIIVSVAPADTGFEAALYWKTPAPANAGSGYSGIPFFHQYDMTEQISNISAVASYKLPDLIKFTLGYVVLPGAARSGPGYFQDNNIMARVELLMVENLTLFVDGRIWGLAGDDNMQMKYVLGAGYKMDALGIYLGAYLGIPPTGSDYVSFGANLEVTYDLGDITLGLIGKVDENNSDLEGMKITVAPYVNLDDFGTRIAVEIISDDQAGLGSLYWAVPIYFTFSIW
jgi:hypothetical protein